MTVPPNQPGQWSDPNQPRPGSDPHQSGQWPGSHQSGQWPDPNRPGQQWSDPNQTGNWWRPPPPPPPKRKPVALWVGLAVAVVVLAGAAIGIAVMLGSKDDPQPAATGSTSTGQRPTATRSSEPSTEPAADTKVVTASDNKSQLTVPKQWTELPAQYRNDVAVIQLGEPGRERYVMVITDDKSDFADFAAFQKAVVDGTKSLVTDAQVGDPSNLTVGGLPAVRREINGTIEGIKIIYWFTMVDGKNGYYQVITWTLPSQKDKAKPALDEVVNSFRETGTS